MDTYSLRTAMPSVTDVYTDLNGLQNLKNEDNRDEALKKVSQQFESMFINMLMKNMRAANDVFSEGNMFDTQEVKFYRDMHDHQLSLSLSHSEGFGIAEVMYRQLTESKTQTRSRQIFDELAVKATHALKANDVSSENNTAAENFTASQASASASVNEASTGASDTQRHQIATTPLEFVQKVLPSAKIAAEKLDVDAETLVAQSALETGWGSKVFADQDGTPTFNLFNIKADTRWQGDSVLKHSLEYLGGKFTNIASNFRSYESIEDSFQDFSEFILNSERYQDAVNTAKNGMDFIDKIHSAGYATDPNYSEKINSVYQRIKAMVASGLVATGGKHEF